MICDNCGCEISRTLTGKEFCWPCTRNKANEAMDTNKLHKRLNAIAPNVTFEIRDGFVKFERGGNERVIINQGSIREILFSWIDSEEKLLKTLERLAIGYN